MGPPTLHLRLLGEVSARRRDGVVMLKPRVQALLAWLVVHRGARHPRGLVAGRLWPESTESQARTNLRNLLFRLRKALPEVDECIEIDGQELEWVGSEAVDVDVTRFEALAERAAELEPEDPDYLAVLGEAVELNTGELCPGHLVDWLDEPRRRLADAFLELADELAGHHESSGETRASMVLTRRMLARDPALEPAYRRLIRLHGQVGDRAGGVRAYHRCVEALRAELGVEPGAATTATYEALTGANEVDRGEERGAAVPRPEPVAHARELVGRVDELERLRSAWGEARSGSPRLVRIHGDAGVGKSRLAQEVLSWGRKQACAATASCHQGVGATSLGPVLRWLEHPALAAARGRLADETLVELARLVPAITTQFPALGAPGPMKEGWQRTRFSEALVDALIAAGPVVLVLDDVQWVDADTLAVVHALMQREDAAVLIVATERIVGLDASHAWPTLFRDVQRRGAAVDMPLEPLDLEFTLLLARSLLGAPPEPALGPRLFAKTEGNPLFVVEFLRAGALPDADADSIPPTVQSVIEGRLAALSEPAAELLRVLGVSDRATDWEVLVSALGSGGDDRDEDAAADAVDELWRRGLVVERGGGAYELAHGLIGEVARARITRARARVIDRRLAIALASSGADPGRVAHHFEAAGRAAEAVDWYLRAARRERALWANDEAIRSAERGLALVPDGEAAGANAIALRELLGGVLLATGEHDLAVESLRETTRIVAGAEDPERFGTLARLNHSLARAAEVKDRDACLAACSAAEAAIDQLDEGEERDRLWVTTQLIRLSAHYWRADVEGMLAIAPTLGDRLLALAAPRDRVSFHQLMTALHHRQHRYAWTPEVERHSHAGLNAGRELDDLRAQGECEFMMGFSMLTGGEIEGALPGLQRGMEIASRTGDAWLKLRCRTYLAMQARRAGDAEAAAMHNADALALATQLGMKGYQSVAHSNTAWARLHQGDVAQALSLARGARVGWAEASPGYPFQWLGLWPLLGALAESDASALSEAENDEVRECAETLMSPVQHWVPEDLAEALKRLVDVPEVIRLREAVALAREHRLL